MQSQVIADETPVVLRNGKAYIKSIKVEQWTSDAPALHLQVFNTNNPTLGTTAPMLVVPIPAGISGRQCTFNRVQFDGDFGGLYFATGLSFAVSVEHDGATAPDAGDEPRVTVDYELLG